MCVCVCVCVCVFVCQCRAGVYLEKKAGGCRISKTSLLTQQQTSMWTKRGKKKASWSQCDILLLQENTVNLILSATLCGEGKP